MSAAEARNKSGLDEIEAKRKALKLLDNAIIERERYRREQEAQINDLVEAGNTELLALNHDILLAKKELKDVKTALRTGRQDKRLLEDDLDVLRVQISEYHGPGLSVAAVQIN